LLKDDEAFPKLILEKKMKKSTKNEEKLQNIKKKNYFLFNKDIYNCFSISAGFVVGLGNEEASSPINMIGC